MSCSKSDYYHDPVNRKLLFTGDRGLRSKLMENEIPKMRMCYKTTSPFNMIAWQWFHLTVCWSSDL